MFIREVKKAYENNQLSSLQNIMRKRQMKRIQRLEMIYIAILIIISISIPFIVAKTSMITATNYQLKASDVKSLIQDEESLLTVEDNTALLKAMKSKVGKYYKLQFINVNEKYPEYFFYSAQKYIKFSSPFDAAIVHDTVNNKYYFWPSEEIIAETAALESVCNNNNNNNNNQMSEELFYNINTKYHDMLSGTPDEVYNKVYNYLEMSGFGSEGEDKARELVHNDNAIAIFFSLLTLLPGGTFVMLMGGFVYALIDETIGKLIKPVGIIDSLIYKHFEEKSNRLNS